MLRPPNATAAMLLAHGAGAGMQHQNLETLARELANRRVATLRFQFPFMQRRLDRGRSSDSTGSSPRSFGPTDRPAVATAAISAAWRRLQNLAGELSLYAAGHSYGARMVSMAAAQGDVCGCRGLVMASYPLHPPKKPSLTRAEHWPRIGLPVLFLSGTHDRMVSPELLPSACERLSAPHQIVWLDAVDHGYGIRKRLRRETRTVFQEMGDAIVDWMAAGLDGHGSGEKQE